MYHIFALKFYIFDGVKEKRDIEMMIGDKYYVEF